MLNVGELTTEKTLLEAFRNAVVEADPDMITGWHTHGFDWPYLIERAKRVDASQFPYMDKIRLHKTTMSNYGQKRPTFPGRVVFDARNELTRNQITTVLRILPMSHLVMEKWTSQYQK
jgi:DNA polymerase elongation subunit (family B)